MASSKYPFRFYVFMMAVLALSLAGCKAYTSYDKALREAEDVEKLVLSRQRIGVLPENIARLANLKELRLFKSNLHELPATIGGLDKLEELVLSDNKLKELPPEIGKLKNLKRLSLHHNQLTHLPKEIGNLENLEVLNLGFNKLDSIPQEIIQLKKLKFLYLHQNQLTKLPFGLEYLQDLQMVNLERNYLNELPQSLSNLPNLLVLNVAYAGNGLEVPVGLCESLTLEELIINSSVIVPGCFAVPGNRELRIILK